MLLSHYEFERSVEFKEGYFNVLVIENPAYLSKVVGELFSQIKGAEGGFKLFENNNSLSFPGAVSVVIDPFLTDINSRDILNKLYTEMKTDALDEELFLSTVSFLSEIEKNVQKIIQRQPLHLESDDPDLVGLFKVLNIRFPTSESLLERICDYIDICSKYRSICLFIFVNLKSFLSQDEIEQLYTHVVYYKINILLIENHEFLPLKNEIIRVIDEDLCDIFVSRFKDKDIY